MKQITNRVQIVLLVMVLTALSCPIFGAEYYLRAEQFNKTMPDGSEVVMWGFAQDSAFGAEDGEVSVPGPVLVVEPDDPDLVIHLDNNLSEPISIVINGQKAAMTPVKFTDDKGRQRIKSFTHETPAGNATAVDYVWNNLRPGTYLYQSGTHQAVQVQMGMYGCLKKDAMPISNLGAAGNYNVFILDNASQNLTNSQGSVAVGGNAILTNYQAATNLAGLNAKVVAGGNINWNTGNVGGGSGYIYSGKTANLVSVGYTGLTTDGQSEVDFISERAYLRAASSYWGTLEANGITNIPPGMGIIELSGSDPTLNIFSVSGADLSGIFVFEITAPLGSTVLVNISGTGIQMQDYLTTLNGIGSGRVLYNLFEASSLTISSHNPQGSILAPFAKINFSSGYINGTLIGESLGSNAAPSTGQARISTFIGNLPGFDKVAYSGLFYNEDVVLVFSEIDPALHAAVAGGNYGPGQTMTSTIDYEPKYFLINGTAYSSGQSPLPAGKPNDRVLLRLVNAGLKTHVPVFNDFYGTLFAEDGFPYYYPKNQYSVELPAAKTKDFVIIPQQTGTYPVYDRALYLTNGKTLGGGMLTYLDVSNSVAMASASQEQEVVSSSEVVLAGVTDIAPAPIVKRILALAKIYSRIFIRNPIKGDLDGDGDVDKNDLRLFLKYYENQRKYERNNPADLNGDGKVDAKDIKIINNEYHKHNSVKKAFAR